MISFRQHRHSPEVSSTPSPAPPAQQRSPELQSSTTPPLISPNLEFGGGEQMPAESGLSFATGGELGHHTAQFGTAEDGNLIWD